MLKQLSSWRRRWAASFQRAPWMSLRRRREPHFTSCQCLGSATTENETSLKRCLRS